MADDFAELNQLATDLDNAAVRVGGHAAAILRRTAQQIVGTAQQFVPVDTAATKTSIGADTHGDGRTAAMAAEIGPTTSYAPYLEYGTARMAPHAFMGPALDRHIPDFVKALEQAADPLD